MMSQNYQSRFRLDFPDKMQVLCVLYISIWSISPPLGYGTLYRVVAVVAAGVWGCIELTRRPSTFFRPSFATLCAIIFILYTALVGYWLYGSEDIIINLQTYICLLFLVFYESYKNRDIRQLRIVFWGALLLLPIWLAITLSAYEVNDHVSRLLTRSTGVERKYMDQGIGGFSLIYSVLIGIPVLFSLTRRFSRLKLSRMKYVGPWPFRCLILLTLCLGCAVVLKSGFSIAVILLVGSVLLMYLVGPTNSSKTKRMGVAIIVMMLILPFIASPALEFVEAAAMGTSYERKIRDIKETLLMSETTGTVELRSERYLRSTNLFLENPVIGTLSFEHIGKHSAILDRFARYGLIVGAMFAYTIIYLPVRFVRRLSDKAFGMALAVAFITVGFSFLNNIFPSFGFMLFIFYPVAVTYLEDSGRINVSSKYTPRRPAQHCYE